MSAIKRYYEDLASMVAEAAYEECYEMGEYRERCEYEAAAADAIFSGDQMQMDRLFQYLLGWFDEGTDGQQNKERPLTFVALIALYPHVSPECLEENFLTSNPLSMIGIK